MSDAPAHCGVGFEQEANEKSFALLQEYLELARSDTQAAGPARGFRFDFYIQRASQQDDAVGQGAESTSGDQGDVQRVQLMLPPPARRSPAQQQAGEFSPEAACPGSSVHPYLLPLSRLSHDP